MPEPVVFGHYLLSELIAAGETYEVFRASVHEEGGDRLVAIKKLIPEASRNERCVSDLIFEAKIRVSMFHKNVVIALDLGRVVDDYYLAMEFVDGLSLREITRICARTRLPLPLSLACLLVAETATGLSYIHSRADLEGRPLNVIHFGISLESILVSIDGEVKIAGFGRARAADGSNGTMKGGVLRGEYGYLSPEMATGRPVDRRTDIFSCGVILWELITGRRLFHVADEVQTIENVRACKVPLPSSMNPQIPAELDRVATKALAADPNDRYQSADELRADLAKVLAGFSRIVDGDDLGRFMKRVRA